MAGELLKTLTGVDIVHVPYKGSTFARNDIVSGQIHMLFDAVPTMAASIKSGMVRAIATSGKTRSAILPDVPTLDEAGAKGFQATLWTGFMAPAGTPKEIVERLNDAISAAVSQPEIRKQWEEQGANPMVMTQPEFATFMQSQVEKWAQVIMANGLTPIN
jgi:tripartite-type tricarboxylate transporter receptor subunit TctC